MQHTSTVANGNGPRPEVEEVWATSSSFTSIAAEAAEDELLPQLLVHPHDNKNKLALTLAGDHQQPLKAVPGLGNKIANWFYYSLQSYITPAIGKHLLHGLHHNPFAAYTGGQEIAP